MHTCDTCPFFFKLENQCRVNPPQPMPVPVGPGQMQVHGIYPPTSSNGWCGKHPAMKDMGPRLAVV